MNASSRKKRGHLQFIKTHGRRRITSLLRGFTYENAKTGSESISTETPGTNESMFNGRPPPIVLTFEANLISLHKEPKIVVSGEIFFWNTATDTQITTKSMLNQNAL
jgi:hypothetical protein